MLKNIFITILLICSVSGVWGQKSVKVKVSGNVITTDGVPAEFINIQLKKYVLRRYFGWERIFLNLWLRQDNIR